MIDTKKLREWAAESENANQLDRALKSVFDELDRVTAERDALKGDAERYRWLRDEAIYFGIDNIATPWCVVGTTCDDQEPIGFIDLDAAIDAAIHACKGEA